MWTLKSYVENSGSDVIQLWHETYSGKRHLKARVRLYVATKYLQQQPLAGWNGPYFHFLKGTKGLGRIGFDVGNIAYRLIGFFGPGPHEFSFLTFAEEHDDEYLPKGCKERAVSRMNSLVLGHGSVVGARFGNK